MILETKKIMKNIFIVVAKTHCSHLILKRAFVAENKYIAEEKMLHKLSNMERLHEYL